MKLSDFELPDTQSFLAMVLVISIVSLVFMLAVIGKSDGDTFKILVGGLMGVGFSNVIGYYFTSSPTSKIKDQTIASLTQQDAKREDTQAAKEALNHGDASRV